MFKLAAIIAMYFLITGVLTGASIWEGSARAAPVTLLPATGYYAATNAFPKNTAIIVMNLENGKMIQVTVTAALDNSSLLILLSKEAATAIALPEQYPGRVRIMEAIDPVTMLPPLENKISNGDPDYDPMAQIDSDRRNSPAPAATEHAPSSVEEIPSSNKDTASGQPEETAPARAEKAPPATPATPPAAVVAAPIEEPPPVPAEEAPVLTEKAPPAPPATPPAAVVAAPIEEPPPVPAEEAPARAEKAPPAPPATPPAAVVAAPVEEPPPVPAEEAPVLAEKAPPATPATPPAAVAAAPVEEPPPVPVEEAPVLAEKAPPATPATPPAAVVAAPLEEPPPVPAEEAPVLAEKAPPATPATPPAAVAAAPVEEPPPVNLDNYNLALVPAENRVPDKKDIIIPMDKQVAPIAEQQEQEQEPDEASFIPSIEENIAIAASQSQTQNGPSADFSVPVITSMEKKMYYVQLRSYSKPELVESELAKVGKQHNVSVQITDIFGQRLYRILIGPVSRSESAQLLQQYKAKGWNDAFIWLGK
ncbi:MAG: SPOR domain-containing protein [Treponema sp.]|nr:SPOR domain-containing protein [Treponema sp.]